MSTEKSTSVVEAAEAEAEIPMPSIPADLMVKFQGIQGFAQTYAVLNKGTYPPQIFQAATDAIGFILQVYQTAVEEAVKHPRSELIPQLKEILDGMKKAKGAQDGQK